MPPKYNEENQNVKNFEVYHFQCQTDVKVKQYQPCFLESNNEWNDHYYRVFRKAVWGLFNINVHTF